MYLIAAEQPTRLGSRDDMVELRSLLMRQSQHNWLVCQNCQIPFDARASINPLICDYCRPTLIQAS